MPLLNIQCTKCGVEKPPAAFDKRVRNTKGGKKGDLTTKCSNCIQQEKQTRNKRKKGTAASEPSSDTSEDEDIAEDTPEVVLLADFILKMMQRIDSPHFRLTHRVNTSALLACPEQLQELDLEYRVKRVARILGEESLIHWTCVPIIME